MVLTVGVFLAVLAFGGTEPASFALVECFFFGAAAFFLATRAELFVCFTGRALLVPAALVGVVLLQLCPLPAQWLVRPAVAEVPLLRASLSTLTIEPHATRAQLLVLLTCIIAFLLAQLVARDPGRARRLVVSLVALGAFEALYGLVQYLAGWQQIFAYVKKYDLEEATGTYINRNHFAGFLEMILPFALALAFYEYARLRPARAASPRGMGSVLAGSGLGRLVLWLSVAVVLFAALICSRSRMGILAAGASLLVVFGFAALSRVHGNAGLLLAAAFAVLAVALAVWIGPEPVVGRFQNVGQEYGLGSETRLSIWHDALGLLRRHPWVGTGFGTFPIAFTAVQTTFLGKFVNHAHNDYLEIAIDLGIPAALLLFTSVFAVLARAARRALTLAEPFECATALACTGSIAAILVHSLADFNLYIPANALLFSLILGLAMAAPPRSTVVPGSQSA
jgi:O-antigen ligase